MKNVIRRSVSAVLALLIASAVFLPLSGVYADRVRAAEGVPGDVNKDGTVNNKDISALFRYINGFDVDVDTIACDVTGDGKINNKDVTLLFKHVSGADVTIFYGVPHTDDPNNIFMNWTPSSASAFGTLKQTVVTSSDGSVTLSYQKNGIVKDPYAVLDIAKYVQLTGRDPLEGAEGSYIVFRMKSTGDGYMKVYAGASDSSDSGSVCYIPDGEWRWAVVDMTGTSLTSEETLSSIRIDWTGSSVTEGSAMTVSEIGFFRTFEEVCEHTGLSAGELMPKPVETPEIPDDISPYYTAAGSTLERVVEDGRDAIKLTTANKTARININASALAALENGMVTRAHYLAVSFKVSGMSSGTVYLNTVADVSGKSASSAQTAKIDTENDGWQGVIFDMRNLSLDEEAIKRIVIDFTGFTSDTELFFGGVTVTPYINHALTACGSSKYLLNYDESLSDNDPLANETLTADEEDPRVRLWFDHTTEKTDRDVTVSGGRTGYTVRMAKNESENCQFFVVPYKDTKISVTVDPFANGENTVPFELYYEYYHNIENVLKPDALPPYTGPVDVPANTSQGFMIQLTTSPETPAGTYTSVVHVYDAETGAEIRRAPVAVRVWDFEISDKTELRTAFALWTSYMTDSYNWEKVSFTPDEVHKNYFEFFDKYRINIMDIPGGMTSSYGVKWMQRDRVNTARWYNRDMSVSEDLGYTPDWLDKVLYYSVDEPKSQEQFAQLIEHANQIRQNTPDYRMVSPMDGDLDMTSDGKIVPFSESDIDQVGYMSQAVTVWCPKLSAFTSRDQRFISQVSFLQSEEQDAKYGVFTDRMKKEVEDGDELWAYICVNPTEPYTNWQIKSDGTEAIVSAWQMKQLGVTGMLYWAVDYWREAFWYQGASWVHAGYGDGMLIYSGYAFGLPCPISSIRLESVRDGIEDYQMLCMLEEALGAEEAADMVSRITTSVVTYADNDDYIHAVRVLLGDTLESVLSGN